MNQTADIIIASIILIVILLLILTIILIAISRFSKKLGKKNDVTNQNIHKVMTKVDIISTDNEEVKKINKQIKDKSESLSKIMEQTNNIYNEVLSIEKENKLNSIKNLENQDKKIPFEGNPELKSVEPGVHLTKMVEDINSAKLENQGIKNAMDKIENNDFNSDQLSLEEVNLLIVNLVDYRKVLNEEVSFYLDEIKSINDNRELYSAQERLGRKEEIYKQLKNSEQKLKEQEDMLEKVKIYKENLVKNQTKLKEENKLDDLINEIAKKR